MFLSNFTIRAKLIIGFGIILATLSSLGYIAIQVSLNLSSQTEKLYKHPFIVGTHIRDIQLNISQLDVALESLVTETHPNQLSRHAEKIHRLEQKIQEDFALVKERFLGDKVLIQKPFNSFFIRQGIRFRIVQYRLEGDTAKAAQLLKLKNTEDSGKLEKELREVKDFAKGMATKFLQEAIATKDQAIKELFILILLGLIISLSVALVVIFSIKNSMSWIVEWIGDLERGNLRTEVVTSSQGEFTGLIDAVNSLVEDQQKNFTETGQNDWQKEGIATLNTELIGELNANKLVEKALDHICLYANASTGVFYLFDSKTEKLNLIAGFATHPEDQSLQLSLREGTVGQSAATGITLETKTLHQGSFVLATPLMNKTDVIGVLEFIYPEEIPTHKKSYIEQACLTLTRYLLLAIQQQEIQSLYLETDQFNKKLSEQQLQLELSNTELLEAQKTTLNAKELAENASSAKSEFLANMSHEIRTPMNAILGFTDILIEDIQDQSQVEYLQIIKNSGTSLLTLINDILDLAKIESGHLPIKYEMVEVGKVAIEIFELFTLEMKHSQIQHEINIDPLLPHWIEIDPLRLRQIILNLLGNAFKFTESGKISLSISSIPSTVPETVGIMIEVEDTGVGISASALSNIFEPFVQDHDQEIAYTVQGTGLGLTIVNKLVKLMGGRIKLESEQNKGTRAICKFYALNFRRDPPKIVDINSKHPLPSDLKGKILVVDDNQGNRDLITNMLKDFSIEVLTAKNGEEGYKVARAENPDLTLMDLKMPKMDGHAALKVFKSHDSTAHIPIIALTADVMIPTAELTEEGFLAVHNKPIDKASLLQLLEKFLEVPAH